MIPLVQSRQKTFAFMDSHLGTFVKPVADFSPADVAGLNIWLDADDASTITKSSDRVSQWDDKSSTGNDFLQATGADQPLWVDAVQNSKPIIRFDGTSEFMDITMSVLSQPNTLFIVCTSPSTDGKGMFDGDSLEPSGRNILNRQATNTYRIGAYTGVLGGTASTAMQIFRVLYLDGDGELDIDGSSILTSQTIGTEGLKNPIIGAFNSLEPSGFSNMDIAEVLFYNASLSTSDKTAVLDYLNDKWAVF